MIDSVVYDSPVLCGEHGVALSSVAGRLVCEQGGRGCAAWCDLSAEPGTAIVVHPGNGALFVVPAPFTSTDRACEACGAARGEACADGCTEMDAL